MKINATLSISYPSSGGVCVRIRDETSSIEFVDLKISHEEFSKALSTLQSRPATDCEVRGLKNVGKRRESQEFKMYYEGALPDRWRNQKGAEEALESAATEQGYAEGGWVISAYFALNSQGGNGKDADGRRWYRMSRTRFVDDNNTEPQHDQV